MSEDRRVCHELNEEKPTLCYFYIVGKKPEVGIHDMLLFYNLNDANHEACALAARLFRVSKLGGKIKSIGVCSDSLEKEKCDCILIKLKTEAWSEDLISYVKKTIYNLTFEDEVHIRPYTGISLENLTTDFLEKVIRAATPPTVAQHGGSVNFKFDKELGQITLIFNGTCGEDLNTVAEDKCSDIARVATANAIVDGVRRALPEAKLTFNLPDDVEQLILQLRR